MPHVFHGAIEFKSPLFEPEYTVYYDEAIVYFSAQEFTIWDGDNDINYPSPAFFTNRNSCVMFLAKLVDALNDDEVVGTSDDGPKLVDRLATMTPTMLISMLGLPSIPCHTRRFVANKCVIYDNGAPLIEFRRGSYSVGIQDSIITVGPGAIEWPLTYACDIPLTAGDCIRNINISGLVDALNANPLLARRLVSMTAGEMTNIAAGNTV